MCCKPSLERGHQSTFRRGRYYIFCRVEYATDEGANIPALSTADNKVA